MEKEEGVIDPIKHEMPLILFICLMLIAVVLAGVDLNSVKEKGSKITRTCIVIGLLVIAWSVVRSLD